MSAFAAPLGHDEDEPPEIREIVKVLLEETHAAYDKYGVQGR